MKIRFLRSSALTLLVLGALFLFGTQIAFADSCTSGGSGNWSTNAWSCGHTPTSTDDVIIADGHDVTLNITPVTINSLTINDGASLSRLGISGANALTINGNVSIVSTTANVTKSLAANSGSVTIGGDVTLTGGANSSTGIAELSIGTTGSATVSGNINVNNAQASVNFIAGGGTLQVAGNFASGGTLTNNTNTTVEYNGAGSQSVGAYTYRNLTLSGGNTKTLAGNANAAGTLTVKAGTTLDLSTFTLGATSAPSVVMEIGSSGAAISGSGALTLGGDVSVNATAGSSGASISTPITLGATRTFTIADDGTSATDLTISGIIGGAAAGITKAGAGTLVLSGLNTYMGVTTINAGTASVDTINNGGAAGNLGQAPSAAANLVLGGGTLQYTGGTATTNRGFTLTAATTSSIEVTANSLTFSSASANTTGALTKTGAGALVLSGGNTFSGGMTLNAGTLGIYHNTAIGSGTFTINGGTITTNGARTLTNNNPQNWNGDFTFNANTTLTMGSGAISLSANRQVTVDLGTLAVDGVISGSGLGLTKNGAATLALSGSNTFSGGMTLNAGTLSINNDTAIGTGTFTINGGTISTNASRTLTNNNPQSWNGNFTYVASAPLNMGTGAISLTANVQLTVNTNSLTVNGVISGSGFSLTKSGNGTLILTAANLHTGGTTLAQGTLDVRNDNGLGSGTFTISGGTVQSGSGARTFTNVVTVTNDFTIGSTNSIHLTGAINLNGGAQNVTVTNSSMDLFMDGVITNGALEKSGSGRLALTNPNSTFSGGVRLSAGSLTFDASSTPTSGTPTKGPAGTGTLTLVAGTLGASNSARTLANALIVQGNITIGMPGATNSVVLNGNVNLVTSDRIITIDAATSPATLGGSISSGSLTKDGTGSLNLGTANHNITSLTINAGTLTSTSGTLTLAGNFSNSSTFVHNGGVVSFYISVLGTRNLTANTATTFNNLSTNGNVTLVETVAADNVTVSGTLSNGGTIRKSQSVGGTGAKTFGLAGAFNGANLSIDVTMLGTLSNLQVDRKDSNHPNSNGTTQQTGRYWSITATGSGFETNLTLPRNNAGAPSVCRYSGSGTTWSCVKSSDTSNSVTRNGIATYSDWAVGNNAPTSLELTSFTAKSTRKHKVRVEWETGNELNLIGFNLYRSNKRRGGYEKLNTELIPAQNIGQAQGAPYKFMDRKVQVGTKYFYKLELIRAIGGDALTPPIKVVVK